MCVRLFLSWDSLTAFVWRSFCYVCPFVSVVGQSDRICVEELLLCVSVCFLSWDRLTAFCVEELLLCVSICFCRGIG